MLAVYWPAANVSPEANGNEMATGYVPEPVAATGEALLDETKAVPAGVKIVATSLLLSETAAPSLFARVGFEIERNGLFVEPLEFFISKVIDPLEPPLVTCSVDRTLKLLL